MPAGGVTEWRGWSFATDEFWTNADRNQGRETSVRNRNVFAVADSDEWDDKAHAPGQFDSTLISPEFKVKGGKTATLSFASNYRLDGPQSGEVFVSYDGGAPQLVMSYTANFNGFESLALDAPNGAKKAQTREPTARSGQSTKCSWTVDSPRALTKQRRRRFPSRGGVAVGGSLVLLRQRGYLAGQSHSLEPPVGFEPTTPALQERCSGQLS